MRILLTTDLHANLLAAQAAVQLARKLGVDEHIHLGDCIDIGPWPRETLDFLVQEKVRLLMGNHEECATSKGLHPALQNRIGEGEKEHYFWRQGQLRSDQIAILEELEYTHDIELAGQKIRLQHFALEGGRISESLKKLGDEDLKTHFGVLDSDWVFFGHIHKAAELEYQGVKYRSLMPSGCSMGEGNGKQALLLSDDGGRFGIKSYIMDWSIQAVHRELDLRKVPDREAIKKIFFQF